MAVMCEYVWETAVHCLLQLHSMNCMLLADYGMSVSAHNTLALDMEMQVDRVIKAGRAKVVDEARLVAAETAGAKSRKMGELEPMAWHQ